MKDILSEFNQYITAQGLICSNDRILLALSGGADSVALLLLLLQVQKKYTLKIEAFHLNHCLRENAGRDENFVRNLCARKNIPLHVYTQDVHMYAVQHGLSDEEAGRIVRYEKLNACLNENALSKIATAHHMDDNTETIIMHLIRGCGEKGLMGIEAKRGNIIRPVLCFSKNDLVNFVKNQGETFVHDETNDEKNYFRNRVRHDILPLFEKENENFSEGLLRFSEIARTNNELVEELSEEIPLKYDGKMRLVQAEYGDVMKVHKAVRAQLLRRMCATLGVVKDISYRQIQDVLALLSDAKNTCWDYDVRDLTFRRSYDTLYVSEKCALKASEPFCYRISKNATHVFVKEKFILRTYAVKNLIKNADMQYIKILDYDKIGKELFIRTRREGDSFHPIGLNGTKTIKKYFVDKKIPRRERDGIALLADENAILAVMGFDSGEECRITQGTKNFLVIEYIAMEDYDEFE